MKQRLLRQLPKMDDLLGHPGASGLLESHARTQVVAAMRDILDRIRGEILSDVRLTDVTTDEILWETEKALAEKTAYRLRPVVNATGVIIHTNLGRSLISDRTMDHVRDVATRYSNLEYNLEQGVRGTRYAHVESLLQSLTGAQAALVVNNNAAAVMLALSTLAFGQEIVVSRGELVEIGGSFRIPEVMKLSGARLVEVGTTNKTHPKDYRQALTDRTGAILKVHTSNYRIMGFTKEVPVEDLVELGRETGIPVVYDLGSGTLGDLGNAGLPPEPTVRQQIAAGIDVVTFSGDKLLGGPQAGVIVGRRDLVDAMKDNQLTRALRVDKMTLAALEATLIDYFNEDKARHEIPTQRMIFALPEELHARAVALRESLAHPEHIDVAACQSQVGGGTFPLDHLDSWCLSIAPENESAQSLSERLRNREIPIIARIAGDRVLLDMRTLTPKDEDTVRQALDELVR